MLQRYVRQFALWLLSWVDSCPTCGAAWSEHLCPQTATLVGRVCEVCEQPLPPAALRTHEGKWRCRLHKCE